MVCSAWCRWLSCSGLLSKRSSSPGISYLDFITEEILCRDVLKKTEDCCHFWGQ